SDVLQGFFAHDSVADVSQEFNYALLADSSISALTPKVAEDLRWDITIGSVTRKGVNGFFTTSADIDGDGNIDLFGANGTVFYGSGLKNTLLKKVVDGLGNFVEVTYGEADTDDHCNGTTWPEKCIKHMTSLVRNHSEGFCTDQSFCTDLTHKI